MKRQGSLALVVAALAVAALALRAGVAANPTIVVNSAADVHDANPGDGVCETAAGNGVCTLRAAIEEANALAGADTITFSSSLSSPMTFLLSLGELPITTDLTITGKGESNTIIDASADITPDRVFLIQGGTGISVAISGVTIQNGAPAPPSFGAGISADSMVTLHLTNATVTHNAAWDGAGISAGGTLTLDHCTISNNTAAVLGGGIYAVTTTVISSTIEGNSAEHGGGGLYTIGGSVTLRDSTINGNSSTAGGGGLRVSSGGTLNLIDTTVTGNFSNSDGGGAYVEGTFGGGALHAFNATITGNQCGVGQAGCGIFRESGGSASIANTILANNYDASKAGTANDCNAVVSLDYNLIRTTANCTITGATTNNINGADPMLGPLQDNGGPTQTEALLTGSPAIDKGNPSGCTDNFGATLTTDQRGFIRPINGRCDMGAYEFGSALPTPTPTRTGTPTSTPTPTPTRTPTPNPLARSFFTLAPCRVIDTRGAPGPLGGPALAAGATRDFVLVGTCGIPASAKAVSINVTVTDPTAAGDLRLFAGGAPLPLVSTINYRAMQTRANNAVVTLGASGDINVLSDQASGAVQFILDVDGYFQ